MTILEPTLYANGALRLTRHGAGKGGTVLVHVPTGEQVDIPEWENDAAVVQMCEEVEPDFALGVVTELRKTYAPHR